MNAGKYFQLARVGRAPTLHQGIPQNFNIDEEQPFIVNKRQWPRVIGILSHVLLIFMTWLPVSVAEEFRINISIEMDGRVHIRYQADTNFHYILYRGTQVTAITSAVAVASGPTSQSELIDPVALVTNGSVFYRVVMAAVKPVTLDPPSGALDVGIAVRPKATFPQPVNTSTLNSNNFYASFAGRKLPATIVPANNGAFAWLFFAPPMPSASQIQVVVDGANITNSDGTRLDAAGDNIPGSVISFNFSTVSVTPVPNTVLEGRIVDPGPDLIPRTPDDVTLGNGYNYLLPIQGAKVYVLGLETNIAFTDANGHFILGNMPVGDVKVVLDGRTATNSPVGYYFAEMVMDTTFSPGITNGVMTIRDVNGNVVRDANGVPIRALAMYLPRIASNILQTVDASTNTLITVSSNGAYNLSPSQQQYLTITISSNSLVGMDGQPMSSGQIGISVVPTNLVSDMLPPGLMQHTFDITVQAPGVATFTTPVQMTFPNVFGTNVASPGTKLNFLSFDHTTGRLVIEGTATVSADGLYVTTDPGTGVTHPGWHGLAPPGVSFDILSLLGNLCPPGCDCAGVVEDASKVVLAISLTAGASAGAVEASPLLLFIGSVTTLGVAVHEIGQKSSFPKSVENANNAAGIISSTLDTTGNLLATPTPGQSKPFYLLFGGYEGARQVLGPKLQQLLTKIGNQAKALGESPFGKALSLFGVAHDSASLGIKLNDCFHLLVGGFGISPSSTGPIDTYLNALAGTTTNITDSLEQLLGQKLFPLMPTNRSIIIGSDGTNIKANEVDGSPFIDPRTGLPLSLAITELLDDRLFSDGDFRTNSLTSLKAGLDQFAAKLSPNDSEFIGYEDELTNLYSTIQQLYRNLGEHSPNASLYYVASDALTGTVIARGKTLLSGGFSFFGPAEAFLSIEVFDPVSRSYAKITTFTPKSGGRPALASSSGSLELVGFPDTSADSDGDGLSDLAEFVIGTDPYDYSTAGDGISDGEKVAQGLDPLSGGGLATGIIANLPLQGMATDVAIAASTNSSGQQTAYIACGSGGLSIVNVSQFKSPVQLGQLNLPGNATGVAVDPTFQIAVVAANSGGLDFLDVSSPLQPQVTLNISNNTSAVQIIAGVVYAATGNTIQAYDLLTGQLLQTLTLGGANVTGVATEGFFLYTMDTAKTLRVIDVTSGGMVARGTLTLLQGGGGLFVGNNIAYVSAISDIYGGFLTVNTANPDGLVLIANSAASSSRASPGPNITVNGSGLGLVAVTGGLGVPPSLQVYNVADPTNTGAFVTAYSLPAAPYKVAIGAGIGFVADGTAGLQVLNYKSFDASGIPPTITLSNSFPMTTPTNGIALEGNFVRVAASTSDDVQVRNVEFYVDGALVFSDQSFPFYYLFVTPSLSATKTNFTLQARAFDTGGNSTWTPLIDVQLAPDTTPPQVRRTYPVTNGIATAITNIVVYFNKPLDGATVNSVTFSLVFAGPDHRLNTADDLLVTGGVVTYLGTLKAAQLSFPASLSYGLYRATLSTNLTDAAGNALTNSISWTFWVLSSGPNGDDDGDGLSNADELTFGTNPFLADTDGDGWTDGQEREEGTDPLDPMSHPSLVYVSGPPIQVLLPVTGGSGVSGITIARPPLEIVLPVTGGSSASGVTVARPPVEIVLPVTGGSSALGTIIANPPILIQHQP